MSKTYDDLRVPDRGKSDDVNSLDLFAFAQRKNQAVPPPAPLPEPDVEPEPEPEPERIPSYSDEAPSMDEPPQAIPDVPPPTAWSDPSSAHIRPGRYLNPQGPSPLSGAQRSSLSPKRGPADFAIPIVAVIAVVVTVALVFGIAKGIVASRSKTKIVAPEVAAKIVDEEPVMPTPQPKPVIAKITRKPAALPAPAAPEKPLLVKIDVPGVRCSMEGVEQVILFDAGLFVSAEKMGKEGEIQLSRVGRQIIASKKKVTITVVGCTDNGTIKPNSRFKNNRELGLLRASAAIKVLQAAGLPAAALKPLSYGETWSPYPNDNSANRSRNRTVVLRLVAS